MKLVSFYKIVMYVMFLYKPNICKLQLALLWKMESLASSEHQFLVQLKLLSIYEGHTEM